MKKIIETYKKNNSDFLFYDYETFGTHTSLDKPAQFASIRTDQNLNIIEEPQCFYCFPPDDYLPDPNAVLITGITPQYTEKHGSNEYKFAKKIHNVLTTPNTCIVGYNNIIFDDEITRNIFYRNFFDPYEWSWKNNNSRWDLLNIVRACHALRPNGIKWPKNEFGVPIFKLSELTKINHILHNNVHDATSDVYATIKIAQLIKKKHPKLFNFFYKYRKKDILYKSVKIESFKPVIYISSYFGAIRNNSSCILPITWDLNNKNVLIAIDLFKDVKKLISFLKKKPLSNIFFENIFDLGVILVHLNRCPILAPIQSLRIKDIKRLNFDIDLYKNRVNLIKENLFLIRKVNKLLFRRDSYSISSNVDLQLYNSFFNIHDKKLINLINQTKLHHLKNIQPNFYDIRLNCLFFRYKARNFFDVLNKNEKKIWLEYCLNIFNASYLRKYFYDIKMLLNKHSNDIKNINLLYDLLKYLCKKYKSLFHKKNKLI